MVSHDKAEENYVFKAIPSCLLSNHLSANYDTILKTMHRSSSHQRRHGRKNGYQPGNPPQGRYIGHFLRHDWKSTLAFIAGLVCVTAVMAFTTWLSKQILRCPEWAFECHVAVKVEDIRKNIAVAQGLVTVIYIVGLAALAYAAHGMSEVALWPLLSTRSLKIGQVDNYLEASRGSIPSSMLALVAARGWHSVFVVFCTIGITLLPLVAAPLTGYVYDQLNITTAFKSQVRPGGGIGPPFSQNNPPTSPHSGATAFYSSWSTGISEEPMQEYQDWFIDRLAFEKRGNMTVRAVKLKQSISCGASKPEPVQLKDKTLRCSTNMKQGSGDPNDPGRDLNDEEVSIRPGQRLTVWAHEYNFDSPTKTSATIFFGAMDGYIEGGELTMVSEGNVSNISAISCGISVEIVEDTLAVGTVPQGIPIPQINFLGRLRNPGGANNRDNNEELIGSQNLNSLALWFVMAPIVVGQSSRGAQPLYGFNEPKLPLIVTSGMDDANNTKWTIAHIEEFIHGAIGALAQAASAGWEEGDPVVMTSFAFTRKLDPERAALLAIPPVLIVVLGMLLMIWNQRRHVKLRLPTMRKAPLGEILESAFMDDMYLAARSRRAKTGQPSRLNEMIIKYDRVPESRKWSLVEVGKNTSEEKGLVMRA
ncbi:hypothetical protein IG631_22078 [Alternaria alternata]|nr:hypothetical protein IG631_22078 [Alternaria alternata]